jgi:hypothetical protein
MGRLRSGPSRGAPTRRGWRAALPWGLLALALLSLLPGSLPAGSTTPPRTGRAAVSSYSLLQRAPFNRPDFYPLDRRPDPALYRPHADWIGRLILPEPAEAAASAEDWVWLEVEQAPAAAAQLVGRRLPLAWSDQPRLRALVGLLTTDIHLGAEARSLAAQGNVVPWRPRATWCLGGSMAAPESGRSSPWLVPAPRMTSACGWRVWSWLPPPASAPLSRPLGRGRCCGSRLRRCRSQGVGWPGCGW